MTRLPKRYFKSISDYVRTYYTAYGAKRAQKLYECVKTVTEGFTRTDPVYVRIGEDGEPEIHYTMTQADGESYFASMDLGNATIYVHNGKVISSPKNMFSSMKARKISIDLLNPSNGGDSVFGNLTSTEKIELGEGSSLLTNNYNIFANYTGKSALTAIPMFDMRAPTRLFYTFYGCSAVKEMPAFDLSSVVIYATPFTLMSSLEQFHCTGMKASFDLSPTAMKHDAILEVFNNLGTVSKDDNITLTLGTKKIALMSDEELAIATEKGWYLA